MEYVQCLCSRPGGGEHGEGLPGGDEPLPAHIQDDLREAGHGETGLRTMGVLYIRVGVGPGCLWPSDFMVEMYKGLSLVLVD